MLAPSSSEFNAFATNCYQVNVFVAHLYLFTKKNMETVVLLSPCVVVVVVVAAVVVI